ncbi:hypothetical protein R1X32_08030 (plasmid) [Rhodococcus opacus]|uniref:Uncharacterized protein n=1 Tax=Rhodococcus opacus M213 TaxID=1129896 RepID=K8XKB4_RHOOP|nr:hypothetical protein [Rhodococcus opacus]EKT82033.1 hypothetical protein WSS_A14374 [Rhodococcus opacus M213]WKN60056.1 hypothetical protein HJ581_0040255 [Rhodococcus opacus]
MIPAAEDRRTYTSDDILDFAILWAPIGGPSAEQIRVKFSLAVEEYRRRLCDAVRSHRRTRAEKGSRALPDRVYATSVLENLLSEYAT